MKNKSEAAGFFVSFRDVFRLMEEGKLSFVGFSAHFHQMDADVVLAPHMRKLKREML
jgi:hypothetical protein